MSKLTPLFALALGATTGPTLADTPRVVVDILPVQMLVAAVMDGAGAPDLLLPGTASPHHFSLKPSQVAALSQADIVFWIGDDLTPWLPNALTQVSDDTAVVGLLEHGDTMTLPFGTGVLFETADDDAHDHADDHEDHHHHDEDEPDPHAWLDPQNALVWTGIIADTLATADPAHADLYRANAEKAQAAITSAQADIAARMDPLRDLRFVVFHDSIQYFEARFGLGAVSAVALGDAARPGPARIQALRDAVRSGAVSCVFREPQMPEAQLRPVLEDSDIPSPMLDPLGSLLPDDTRTIVALYEMMAQSIEDCAAG